MGARGNIAVVQHPTESNKSEECIYLYTHWGGEYVPFFVQQTLAKRTRWDDEAYLCRMLFCAMVAEDVHGEHGFGITSYVTDYEFPLLVVDCARSLVTLRDLDAPAASERSWTFEEFVTLALDAEDPWSSLGYVPDFDDEDTDEDDAEDDGDEEQTRRFEFSDGKSNKFWEITLSGEEHTVRFGKIGTSGQMHTKSFDSEEEARRDYEKLVAEKLKKGYSEVK